MRKVLFLLAAISLVLAITAASAALAAEEIEPTPNANPCYMECKDGCYATYAADLNDCSANPYPGESPEDCAENAHANLQGCKAGCTLFGEGCGSGM